MKQTTQNTEKNTLNNHEIRQKKRGFLLQASAFISTFLIIIAGMFVGTKIRNSFTTVANVMLPIGYGLSLFLILLNYILAKRYLNHFKQMKVEEFQHYLLSHRESAKELAQQKLKFLQKCRHFTDAYAILIAVLAGITAFCVGISYDTSFSIVFYFLSSLLFLASLTRIRFKFSKTLFEDDKFYVSENDFPELYALVKKAARTLNCDDNIKIAFWDDFNAGIAKLNNTYSVQLGAILLNLLSKEELYNVLLHEFAHMANDKDNSMKESLYHHWIITGTNPHFFSEMISFLYSFADTLYIFHFTLYNYAISVVNETSADQKMAEYGDVNYASSALLKLKYHELSVWEGVAKDTECIFEPEMLAKTPIKKEIEMIKNAISLRADFWNQLIDIEILSRSASHPTLKMRLQTLGISNPVIFESEDCQSYKDECAKATDYVEELVYQQNMKQYKELRKIYYLEPKEKIEKWEANQKPLKAESYADIVQAFRYLGKTSEAIALCERAIEELDDTAACFAYFMKGCFLLHSYDASGIDYIYKAVENNSNYIDEGLEMIGEFCCLTGREQELQQYRQKAITLGQKQRDCYDELVVLNRKDQLVTEHLPEELLKEILTFIRSIDNGTIQTIYLVRKVISDDFFTSAFIVHFTKDADMNSKETIMHQIFSYLDTCADWQFSLFDYSEVPSGKIKKVPNSCVYEKTAKFS